MTSVRLSNSKTAKLLAVFGIMAVASVLMVILAQKASAHGFIETSRAALCQSGQNTDCGAVIYEPQSLEAPKGFPAAGPADGKLASAGGIFPKLDEQSATRWTKVNMSPGQNTFTWDIRANHATTSWKYYITKANWNPNAPLTRDSFELTPFCTVNYGGAKPPSKYSDTCNVPERTGYQVIYAVWEIADTVNAFYNVIDVNFGNNGGGTTDTQAPTTPAALAASGTTATSTSLTWNASSDNVGVTGYKVYNGNSLVTTVSASTLNYTVTGLTANTAYTFTVKATDAAGNESAASNAVNVTTTGASTGYPAWNASTVYVGGNKVTHNGVNYEAKWWTQGQTPGTTGADVWKVIQ